ncbi:MAG: ABC transporter permease [Acidobacteriota bacterium]
MLNDLRESWWIAQKDLKMITHDIQGLVVYILIPIVIVIMTVYSLDGVWEGDAKVIDLPVILQSDGPNTMVVLNALARDKTVRPQFYYKENGRDKLLTVKKARELVYETKAVLIIPEGFEESINGGGKAAITMVFDPGDHVISNRVLVTLNRLISEINSFETGSLVAMQNVSRGDIKFKKKLLAVDKKLSVNAPNLMANKVSWGTGVEVRKVAATDGKQIHVPTPLESCFPGWAVTFMLLGTTFAAATLIDEKEQGTLRRLQAAPISRYSILMGKLISGLVQSNVQMALIFAIAYVVYGLWLGADILGLVALTLATTFAAAGLGVLLAAFCKTKWQARGIGLFVVILSSVLGGCWWPLYLAPETMQKMSRLTLSSWAMDGYHNLLIYGRGLSSIATSLIILVLMGTVFITIAAAKFNSHEYW